MHLDKRTDHGLGPILILSDLWIFLSPLSLSTAVPLRLLRAVCRTPPFHGTEVLERSDSRQSDHARSRCREHAEPARCSHTNPFWHGETGDSDADSQGLEA